MRNAQSSMAGTATQAVTIKLLRILETRSGRGLRRHKARRRQVLFAPQPIDKSTGMHASQRRGRSRIERRVVFHKEVQEDFGIIVFNRSDSRAAVGLPREHVAVPAVRRTGVRGHFSAPVSAPTDGRLGKLGNAALTQRSP